MRRARETILALLLVVCDKSSSADKVDAYTIRFYPGSAETSSVITLGAESIKKELVPGRAKSTRHLHLERRNAPLEFIQLLALVALEVVVMLLPGYFIARRIARNLDRLQPTLVHQ